MGSVFKAFALEGYKCINIWRKISWICDGNWNFPIFILIFIGKDPPKKEASARFILKYAASAVKKPVAILFLLLFSFYTIGYYFVYRITQYRNDQVTGRQLDSGHYDGAEIVILTIPVSLPYLPQFTREEPITGKMQINGKWYNKVSRRLVNNTYFIKCVLDYRQQSLAEKFGDFISFIFDMAPGHHTDGSQRSLLKEFLPLTRPAFLQPVPGLETGYSRLTVHLPAPLFSDNDTPPPRAS